MRWNFFDTRKATRTRTATAFPRLAVESLDDRSLPSAVLVNEVMINPPGSTDMPNEFIELRVEAGASLSNVYVVAIEGEKPGASAANPGSVDYSFDLSSYQSAFDAKFGTGNAGLILITGTGHGYSAASATALVILDPTFSGLTPALENGSSSFVTLTSTGSLAADLDADDNGVLDVVSGVAYVDGVGYRELVTTDFVYGANINQSSGTPDILVRDKDNNVAHFSGLGTADWYAGEITGSRDANGNWAISSTFGGLPAGTKTTAGALNPV